MTKTSKPNDIGIVNEVKTLPKGYQLFTSKDSYKKGDLILFKSDDDGNPSSWLELSEACFLVKKQVKIIKDIPIWRKL